MEFLEVGNDARSHGQLPALVEVEHVALLLLSPLLVVIVHQDVPQTTGIAVSSYFLTWQPNLWNCGANGRFGLLVALSLLKSTILLVSSTNSLSGQVHPWLVVVPLVLVVGRGVHTSKLECLVKCREEILMPEP